MEGVTRIRIGGIQIGIVNLEGSFKKIALLNIDNDDELKHTIFHEIKKENYVPPSRENEYIEGLYRAYRQFQGEEIEEEMKGLEIQVLGQGCPRCEKLAGDVTDVLSELQIEADFQHIRDPRAIADFGILAPPVLVINTMIISAGNLPKREEIIAWIKEVVAEQQNRF